MQQLMASIDANLDSISKQPLDYYVKKIVQTMNFIKKITNHITNPLIQNQVLFTAICDKVLSFL